MASTMTSVPTHTVDQNKTKTQGRKFSLSEKKKLIIGLSKVARYTREIRRLMAKLNIRIPADGKLILDLNEIENAKLLQLSNFVGQKLRDLRKKQDEKDLQNGEELQGAPRGLQEGARLEAQQNKSANIQLLKEKQAMKDLDPVLNRVSHFPPEYAEEIIHHRAIVFTEEDEDWDPFIY